METDVATPTLQLEGAKNKAIEHPPSESTAEEEI